jgi:hypothetical protein
MEPQAEGNSEAGMWRSWEGSQEPRWFPVLGTSSLGVWSHCGLHTSVWDAPNGYTNPLFFFLVLV